MVAGAPGGSSLSTDGWMLLTKRRGKFLHILPISWGHRNPGSWHPTFRYLSSCLFWTTVPFGSQTQSSTGCYVQMFGKQAGPEEASWVGSWGLEKSLFLCSKTPQQQKPRNSIIATFYWAPTCARHFTYICTYNSHNILGGRHYHHHFTYEETEVQ